VPETPETTLRNQPSVLDSGIARRRTMDALEALVIAR